MRKINQLKIKRRPRKKVKLTPHWNKMQWAQCYRSLRVWYVKRADAARVENYKRWAVFTLI